MTDKKPDRDHVNLYRVMTVLFVTLISFMTVSASEPTEVGIYGVLLVAANFAGYIHTCTKDTDSFQRKALTAQSLMISAGFVTVLASAFSSVLQPMQPRNVVIYVSIFVLFSISMIPDEFLNLELDY
ncbi:hypothetical protein GLT92_00070 [Nanohaloarchaea archaeon]|nr:hypothetical protein [Candidatus Nanohaloarchaea archaeon]